MRITKTIKYSNKKLAKADKNCKTDAKILLEQKTDKLDLFVKKENYSSFGVILNHEKLDNICEFNIPSDNGEHVQKVEEKPRPIPLVADRKNYEKTRHKASTNLFEFALAQDAALVNAFSSKPKTSISELFKEFDPPEDAPHDANARQDAERHDGASSSTPFNGHEPGWDGKNTHVLPGVKGTSHYVKFGFPGFVPCADQGNLPAEGYTRVLTSSLWVGNIDRHVSEAMLLASCAPFGEVKTVSLMPESGYAFVRFATRAAAEKALKGLQRLNFGSGAGKTKNELKVRWGKGAGIARENFTYVDGVSYVATPDVSPLRIRAEPLAVDDEILKILGEGDRARRQGSRLGRSRSRSKGNSWSDEEMVRGKKEELPKYKRSYKS